MMGSQAAGTTGEIIRGNRMMRRYEERGGAVQLATWSEAAQTIGR